MGLFDWRKNKFEPLKTSLSGHESASEEKLHSNHPHLKELFNKHQIDLKKVRRKGAKVTAAAAVLGAFLAIPHLIGQPSVIMDPQAAGGKEIHAPVSSSQPNALQATSNLQGSSGGQVSVTSNQTAPQVGGGAQTTPPEQPKSQGHIHGRSYMAPPKEHGLHDLGLHKGEAKNPQVPDAGPHPSELDVNQGGDKR